MTFVPEFLQGCVYKSILVVHVIILHVKEEWTFYVDHKRMTTGTAEKRK